MNAFLSSFSDSWGLSNKWIVITSWWHFYSNCRYFFTEPAATRPQLLRRPPPRPEGPPKPLELKSPTEPFVFSPPNKARRVQLFGGDIRTAGEANRESSTQDFRDRGTPADAIMVPMSSDPKTALRPTLNRYQQNFLRIFCVCCQVGKLPSFPLAPLIHL